MEAPPFSEYLGMRLVRRDPEAAEVELDLGPQHLNRRGVAHGGVVMSLLDSALGLAVIAAIPEEWWCATISLDTSFLAGAGPGTLTASGRVTRRGRKVAYASGEARDASGKLVATAQGAWHLWPHRPSGPVAAGPGRIDVLPGGDPLTVSKILAVGRNYAEHVREMGAPPDRPPVFFLKPPSALTGPGRVTLPRGRGDVHHELELVVAIGARARDVSPEEALDHVLGYGVGLDLTLRDEQSGAKERGEPWSLSKGFDQAAPVSAIAPRDAVGDVSDLEMSLDVNDERRQHDRTSRMLRSVPELVSYLSGFMTLERGDLVFTGTPAGVGPLEPGDRVVATIERVGALEIEVSA